jgi:hypothetical protein
MNSSKAKYAIMAGVCLLLMAVAAGYSYGFVHNTLVIPEDPSTTLENLKGAMSTFWTEIMGWLLILILDVAVAWTLYMYLKRVNQKAASVMAWLRYLYSAILAVAIYQLTVAASLVKGGDAIAVAGSIKAFESYWSGGLIIFGLHLVALGYLTNQSTFVPRFFGWLLMFAGVCYFGIHTAKALLPALQTQIVTLEMVLSLPMALGEIGLAFWLVFFSQKAEKKAAGL